MVSSSLLALFIPTFFVASVTPGMCMTLSMTLGMTVGVRRTMWMMLGELTGIGLVAVLCVAGVASLILSYPDAFTVIKAIGGIYLVYVGIQMWMSKGKMAISFDGAHRQATPRELIVQGFVTAVSNPKSWAFLGSLLPPFISPNYPLVSQLSALISIMLLIEFACLMIYASGGKTLSHLLKKSGNVRLINRITGTLMIVVGIWLGIG